MRIEQPDTATYCALAALAFIVACVAHEVIGHGGACLATGGSVALLSTSLFRCTPTHVIVDLGGPLASLLAAGAAFGGLAVVKKTGLLRAFLTLVLAIAGFWFAGQLVASAITNTDDFAFVLQGLAPPHSWLVWRLAMGATGAALYAAVLRYIAPNLPAGTPLVAAYVTVGVVACVSAFFFRAALLPDLREAALESFGASVGLLYLALRPSLTQRSFTAPRLVACRRPVIMFSVVVVVAFWLALGRGFVGV